MNQLEYIQKSSTLSVKSIQNTLNLLDSGATIPFIARYRKEVTGNLDEVEIALVRDLGSRFTTLISRKQNILESIEEQGKLDSLLKSKIQACWDPIELEDLYLPYKQKRETKADKARKAGLEPFAKTIITQGFIDVEKVASQFVNGIIKNESEAIQGAVEIIAQWINENLNLRAKLRFQFTNKAVLQSKLMKGKVDEGEKYRDLYEFSQPLNRVSSHRFLAAWRGDREGILSIKAQPDFDEALEQIERFYVKGDNDCSKIVKKACKEAYSRLIAPSLETEVFNIAKEKADKEAIKIFTTNLRNLLLASPAGAKRILAIDPGFRSGCKVVCLNEQGDLLHNETLFPHPPQQEKDKAKSKLFSLVQAHKIELIAIGDGTAGRETEALVRNTPFDRDVDVYMVSEDGASIYSASAIARKEFPNHDVTVRGAVSIGRRLADPLAELVKIDAKSLGIGQYQHEVNQSELKIGLDDVVMSCVNAVGVDVNRASSYILNYVSGLGPKLAENIVDYRKENGRFKSREELKKVKLLGGKAFEQCAGFLRISEGENPLDDSAVHPESYSLVKSIAKNLKVDVGSLIGNGELLKQVNQSDFSGIDAYTFKDVLKELQKPSRDPRVQAKAIEFDAAITKMSDLRVGMQLVGLVTNVTAFGAFVNIGLKENGLIHKSQLASHYVEDPTQYIKLHEQVQVQVVEIDEARKRIGLKRLS